MQPAKCLVDSVSTCENILVRKWDSVHGWCPCNKSDSQWEFQIGSKPIPFQFHWKGLETEIGIPLCEKARRSY